jgi:penicillin G amidase
MNQHLLPLVNQLLRLISRTRLPRLDGQLRLAGLSKPVEIRRDDWGVPHIYADNLADLIFAQGFVHAQDRLWQMEFNRRIVSGRLAEILGSVAVDLDRWVRTLTMRRVAEYEVTLLSEEARGFLQSYANGVNMCMVQQRLPIEFTLLHYKPEPWTIADTLSWIKMMSWTLSVNWEAELTRAKLVARLGTEIAAELEPLHLQRWPYVLPPDVDYSTIGQAALETAQKTRPFMGPSPYDGLGSNNWVLAGDRTQSGKPMLANDMHLQLSAPGIWYENHLSGGGIDVTGVTFPGIPGVVAGHNGSVAWGFTNGFPDVQDLYVEHLRRTEDGRMQVEHNGVWEDARVLHETILVKGEEPVEEEVIITRHGPVINSLADGLAGEEPLALRWTSLEPDTMIHTMFTILRARNCSEFHEALRDWTSPVQHIVYADVEGNIAYTFTGKIPIRAKSSGRLPVPGWTDEFEWLGYIPFDKLPHIVNPDQGYIATANNRVFRKDYPINIELEPISGDRAQRIAEMILDPGLRSNQDKIDLEFIKRMQFDLVSPSARVILRYLVQLPLDVSVHKPETDVHVALKLLKDWDGTLSANSAAAVIYQVFIHMFVQLVLKDKLDPPGNPNAKSKDNPKPVSLTGRYMGRGPTPVLAEFSLFAERWLPWLTQVLANPSSHWFDLGKGETRDDVIHLGLRSTLDYLSSELGKDMQKWSWGKLHKCTFQHVLSANPVMAGLFNRGPYPIGGDSTTIWAAGTGYTDLGTSPANDLPMIGPPYRMIIDLGDLRNSLSLLAPGQSGNPASVNYDNQIKAWFKAGYHPMLYLKQDVEKHTRRKLNLSS